MEPQFKELKFKSLTELNDWLRKLTSKLIRLEDNGQDMQMIWVHQSGEILNCDYNSRFYLGKFIDMNALKKGNPLRIWNKKNQDYKNYNRLIIRKINSYKSQVVKPK